MAGRASGHKNFARLIYDMEKNSDHARAYSGNDAQSDHCETVKNKLQLPYFEQIRLKKIAQRRKMRKEKKHLRP